VLRCSRRCRGILDDMATVLSSVRFGHRVPHNVCSQRCRSNKGVTWTSGCSRGWLCVLR
jgi:hypothetical protein